jgi:nucleotide-binding universal stress UspA family protein
LKDGIRILVAYDDSGQSKRALQGAVAIARRFNGSISVLRVFPFEPGDSNVPLEEQAKRREERLRMLEGEVRNIVEESKVPYKLRAEHGDNISSIILEDARRGKFDLIAIGTRSFGTVKELLLGSVSHEVILKSECDVLITK